MIYFVGVLGISSHKKLQQMVTIALKTLYQSMYF